MGEIFETKKKIHVKKFFVQFFFVFYIFLNIIDFLNIIADDLDFFKKILSWVVIGYVFYISSFSKILLGERKKWYDIAYIFSFSLMTIPKSILLYVKTNPLDNYIIFGFFLKYVASANQYIFLNSLFLTGLILTIAISISLWINILPLKESLIGSFSNSIEPKRKFSELFLLLLSSTFLGLVVFNFFMEWFALSVDALILVFGMFYYLFLYLHRHTDTKLSSLLSNISNSGNDFFQNLIKSFSDKKTVFIGISFLLTLHLLVDVGVYLVPYSIGTQNTLYFQDLSFDSQGNLIRDHTSIFNFFNFKNSQIYADFSIVGNNFLLGLSVLIIHLTTFLVYAVFMITPFYIFYKNIQNKKIKIPNILGVIFLSSIIFLLLIMVFIPNVDVPIKIGQTQSVSIKGVDLYTSPVTNQDINNEETFLRTAIELLLSFLLFIVSSIFLLFRYQKYKIYFEKIFYTIILLFFIFYISIFFMSTLQQEINSVTTSFKNTFFENQDEIILKDNALEFDILYETYSRYSRSQSVYKSNIYDDIITYSLFSTYKSSDEIGKTHSDYILYELESENLNDYKIILAEPQRTYIKYIDSFNFNTLRFKSDKTQIIYRLDDNTFSFEDKRNPDFKLNDAQIQSYVSAVKAENSIFLSMQNHIEILRIIYNSIFYIFGLVGFVTFFIRHDLMK